MLVNFLLAIFLEFDFRFVRKQVSLTWRAKSLVNSLDCGCSIKEIGFIYFK